MTSISAKPTNLTNTAKQNNSARKVSLKRILKALAGLVLFFCCVFLLPLGFSIAGHFAKNNGQQAWWDLRRDSSQQAPIPADTDEAIIQVYAARAARWRGAFGVHSWIVTKSADADSYKRIEVIGYQLRWRDHSVRVSRGKPDAYWYGSKPWLLREIRGGREVEAIINRLHNAANNYPLDSTYNVWPGPNSNTFIAWLGRQVPELSLELPATAIGKDYLDQRLFGNPPSGRGLLVSWNGLAGVLISPEEGLEINLLGLTAGIDLNPPAVKLPGVGRFGFSDFKRYSPPED